MLVSLVLECSSQEDFLKRVSVEGLEIYTRRSKVQGVICDGRKYRFKRFGIDLRSSREYATARLELQRTKSKLQSIDQELPSTKGRGKLRR